jgi:hypothetical protein
MKFLPFAFFALIMGSSAISLALPCDISLHTVIYADPHSSVGYELIAYENSGPAPIWFFVTYKLYPKQEVERIFVRPSWPSPHQEVYTGTNAAGQKVSITIDTTTSYSVAPFTYKAQISPDPNPGTFYTAQRINLAHPKANGGGVLGRLDICN